MEVQKQRRDGRKMDCRVIDMNRDPRRAQFDYFCSLANPYAGVTVNADITALLDWTKRMGSNFFLTLLYAVSRAANSVPELRRRIRGETVVEYDWCPTSHTVALDSGTYCYCTLTADMPLADFLPYGKAAQERAKKEPSLDDGEEADSLFFISCLPWLSYTALVQPVPFPSDSNPRITWGRYFQQEGRMLLPVTLLVHHALADGLHIARFYEALDRELAAITEGRA